MVTKLTVTLEKEVIERAKRYAQSTGRSLSDLIEKYLDTISQNQQDPGKMPKSLQKLFGSVNIPSDLNHKSEIRKILRKRNP